MQVVATLHENVHRLRPSPTVTDIALSTNSVWLSGAGCTGVPVPEPVPAALPEAVLAAALGAVPEAAPGAELGEAASFSSSCRSRYSRRVSTSAGRKYGMPKWGRRRGGWGIVSNIAFTAILGGGVTLSFVTRKAAGHQRG